jgi:hypothetical protein
MTTLTLLDTQGQSTPYAMQGRPLSPPKARHPFNRIAYSAAHVVADARSGQDPWLSAALDWDATLAYRHHLWSLGLGVAEAMDTAQRGMGMDWPTSRELIRRTLAEARGVPGALVASGCGTDHLDLEEVRTLDQVIRAYDEQIEAIEAMNGRLIVMASLALVKVARGPGDYEKVYDHILSQVREPVILHWLGDMFDPQLAGYWGHTDLDKAAHVTLDVMRSHTNKVDGIKISLLDKNREISLRRQLPAGVRMYTGDDFNYAELIAGDGQGEQEVHRHSDALLGIFDAIAPAASAALSELASGHTDAFHAILAPTVPLSRHIFQAPTRFYKTGVVFMAWLNGHQSHFAMVGGQQSTRSLPHLCELFRLADRANLLTDPELAAQRMRMWLAVHGVN